MQLSHAKQAVVQVNEAWACDNATGPALSKRLVLKIVEALRLICLMPMAWKMVDNSSCKSVRHCRVKVFPDTPIYPYKLEGVGSLAFANTHRRPNHCHGTPV